MAFELDMPAALKLGRSSLTKPPRHTPTFSELPLSSARAEMSGIVKGFRMPASHCVKGCLEAGVRKASKEETAGEVCAGGSVGLWGFKARFCATWPLSDGAAGLNG